jgi:hypothetical protein
MPLSTPLTALSNVQREREATLSGSKYRNRLGEVQATLTRGIVRIKSHSDCLARQWHARQIGLQVFRSIVARVYGATVIAHSPFVSRVSELQLYCGLAPSTEQ